MALSHMLTKGILFLDNGKVPPLSRILSSRRRPEDTDYGYLRTVDSDVDIPSWIDSDATWECRSNDFSTRTYNDFFLCSNTSSDTISTEVTSPYTSSGCFFHILNTRNYDKVTVEATGCKEDGSTMRRTCQFVSGSQVLTNSHPVSITFDDPIEKIHLEITGEEDGGSILQSMAAKVDTDNPTGLSISLPTPIKAQDDCTPIFLISVDTFRFDHLDALEPVISMLGNNTIVPAEPRTQGRYTRPSHGSLLTGVHPGTHGYCTGYGQQLAQDIPITALSPELRTLPEFLTAQGYTCGACTSWSSVTPNFGFGRGFQEFIHEDRDWKGSSRDGGTVINSALEWTEQMMSSGQSDFFYFMHVFDPHFPYLTYTTLDQDTGMNVERTEKYKEFISSQPLNYDELVEYSDSRAPGYLEEITDYYKRSLETLANKLVTFFSTLDAMNILDDSLVIIVGDHGEEFLERGTAGHATLNDTNIRPGMIIKPPKGEEFPVPEQADLIDIYPTISDYIAGTVPDQCAGESWLRMDRSTERIRITEAFTGDSTYVISVEKDNYKGIFSYDAEIPDRPTLSQVQSGTKTAEYYTIDSVRGGQVETDTVPESTKEELEELSRDFISNREHRYKEGKVVDLSGSVERHLEDLGYK